MKMLAPFAPLLAGVATQPTAQAMPAAARHAHEQANRNKKLASEYQHVAKFCETLLPIVEGMAERAPRGDNRPRNYARLVRDTITTINSGGVPADVMIDAAARWKLPAYGGNALAAALDMPRDVGGEQVEHTTPRPASPQPAAQLDSSDPAKLAGWEWDNEPAKRARFSTKERFVTIRVAEMTGQLRCSRAR